MGFGTRILAPVARAGASVLGKVAPAAASTGAKAGGMATRLGGVAAAAGGAAAKAGAAVGRVGGKLATSLKQNWKTIAAHTALNGAALAGTYYITSNFNKKIAQIEVSICDWG